MQREDVARVELTISPDVAFQLLNRKRNELTHIEEQHNKPVLVRVGGGRLDYIDIAAFDTRNQALATDDEDTLKKLRPETGTTYRQLDDPELPETVATVLAEEDEKQDAQPSIEDPPHDQPENESDQEAAAGEGEKPKKKRRRRRRRKSKSGDETAETLTDTDEKQASDTTAENEAGDSQAIDEAEAPAPDAVVDPEGDEDTPKKKRRRRRRGGRGRKKAEDQAESDESHDAEASDKDTTKGPTDEPVADALEPDPGTDNTQAPEKKKRSRSRSRKKKADPGDTDLAAEAKNNGEAKPDESSPAKPDAPKRLKPSARKKIVKRNAPPPDAVSAGYSNRRADDRE